MSTLRQQIEWQYRYYAKHAGRQVQIEEALQELGLLDIEDRYSVYLSTYGELPSVTLRPKHVLGLMADFQTVVDTTPTLADAAKALLPKVGKWEKGFDSTANEVTLTGTFKGVQIILKDATPAGCTVETVEEDVHIPEANYKRTRYRLKGDCDPLLEPK